MNAAERLRLLSYAKRWVLQRFDGERYVNERVGTDRYALAAHARAERWVSWRLIRSTTRLPDKPPKAAGLSGTLNPTRCTFCPGRARARWR